MSDARYHRAALEMLGVPARRSPERARLIAEREQLCGVTFPPAVVEWFALEDSHRLFHDNSNEDRLEALEELGDPAETRQGYLCVGIENQGVVAFYVRLDEGDDPPTYDNNDEFGRSRSTAIAWNLPVGLLLELRVRHAVHRAPARDPPPDLGRRSPARSRTRPSWTRSAGCCGRDP